MIKESLTVFTVCNVNFLSKALVLADSVFKNNGIKLNIYIFDRKREISFDKNVCTISWVVDLDVPQLKELAFKYDVTEFTTSLKPWITLMLLNQYEKVVFLDPDIKVYNSLSCIFSDLDRYNIIYTPHRCFPQDFTNEKSEMDMMRFGGFNMGFYAVKKSDETLRYLKWYSSRCFVACFHEPQFGLSTDQKWATLAPCFFEGILVSKNLGLNVAIWNLTERELSQKENGEMCVNDNYPLIFFHFSNLDSLIKKVESSSIISRMISNYKEEIYSKDKLIKDKKYYFDYMNNGEYITPALRRAYASILSELPPDHDPFLIEGIIGKFAKKNHLLSKGKPPKNKELGFNDIDRYRQKMKIPNSFIKFFLKVVGPEKFVNISRLLVYLSSLRLNKYLWRS